MANRRRKPGGTSDALPSPAGRAFSEGAIAMNHPLSLGELDAKPGPLPVLSDEEDAVDGALRLVQKAAMLLNRAAASAGSRDHAELRYAEALAHTLSDHLSAVRRSKSATFKRKARR
jgi:hypothetical protein